MNDVALPSSQERMRCLGSRSSRGLITSLLWPWHDLQVETDGSERDRLGRSEATSPVHKHASVEVAFDEREHAKYYSGPRW